MATAYNPDEWFTQNWDRDAQNPDLSNWWSEWDQQTPASASDSPPSTWNDPGRDQVADWYRSFLGREGGEDELTNWLTGQYGWGDANNLDRIRYAIENSEEARQYREPRTLTPRFDWGPQDEPMSQTQLPLDWNWFTSQPGSSLYMNTDWWSRAGLGDNSMFDLETGQLKPGWVRTANGYEWRGSQPLGMPGGVGNVANWFKSLTEGVAPTPENLAKLEATLRQFGIRLGEKNARGWSDVIILPNGQMIDVIEAADTNTGKQWQWATLSGQPSVNMPTTQYSDAYTKLMEQLLQMQIQRLMQGVYDPYRQQYQDALSRRASQLGQAETQYTQLLDYLQKRFTDLQGPGYTGAEHEAIRTQALDPIESDRNAARKRVMERLAAAGHTMQSGVMQAALKEVDTAFDAMRATTQTTMATNDLQRREGRSQRAEMISKQLVDIPDARSREQLDVFSALEELSRMARMEDDARSREATMYSSALADLGPQRLQLAMSALGQGDSPASMFSQLLQLAGLNQNANIYNQGRRGSLWSGLGSLAAILGGR